MGMEQKLFEDTDYGKVAIEKIKPTDPNFRLYYAGWLGKNGEADVMEIRGAVFRQAKSGPNKGRLCMIVRGSEKTVYVTVAEMDAMAKQKEPT
jgi:hypothetical protein